MDNLLRDDPQLKSVWHAARRVEKADVLKKSPEKQGTLSPGLRRLRPWLSIVSPGCDY